MPFLKWLLLTCSFIAIGIAAERFGAISYLIDGDRSYICIALLVVLVLGSTLSLFGRLDDVRYLADLSPMAGLAGSIYGMMRLFSSGFEDPTLISVGLATALNTTLAGIIVATMLSLYCQVLKPKLEFSEIKFSGKECESCSD